MPDDDISKLLVSGPCCGRRDLLAGLPLAVAAVTEVFRSPVAMLRPDALSQAVEESVTRTPLSRAIGWRSRVDSLAERRLAALRSGGVHDTHPELRRLQEYFARRKRHVGLQNGKLVHFELTDHKDRLSKILRTMFGNKIETDIMLDLAMDVGLRGIRDSVIRPWVHGPSIGVSVNHVEGWMELDLAVTNNKEGGTYDVWHYNLRCQFVDAGGLRIKPAGTYHDMLVESVDENGKRTSRPVRRDADGALATLYGPMGRPINFTSVFNPLYHWFKDTQTPGACIERALLGSPAKPPPKIASRMIDPQEP